MAWLYVPELEDLNLDSEKQFQDIELFVLLKGGLLQRPFSWQGWKRRSWIQHLFGTISQPLMASLGVEKWILSLPDSLASLSRDSGKEKAYKTKDGFLTILCELPKSVESHFYFLKMSQVSFNWGLKSALDNLPRWGTMQNGVVYPQDPPALPICEKGFLCLPTPLATDCLRGNTNWPGLKESVGGIPNPIFLEWMMGLPLGWTDPFA